MSREGATPGVVQATRIALLEIAEILQPYATAVIVGGMVPYLLIPQDREPHEGTVDIDIVLDIAQPGANPILTLHEVLERHLFQQDAKKPFRYWKGVAIENECHLILIEFLSGGKPPPGGIRSIKTEDIHVSIIDGMQVALESPIEIQLADEPLSRISVASIPTFFAMKAVALSSREELKRTKDAYDIIYCLRNFDGGVAAIVRQYRMVLSNPLVASGIELLAHLFESERAIGPTAYSKRADDDAEAKILAREAYERVQELLIALWA